MRTEWCYGPQKLNYVELKKAGLNSHVFVLARHANLVLSCACDRLSISLTREVIQPGMVVIEGIAASREQARDFDRSFRERWLRVVVRSIGWG